MSTTPTNETQNSDCTPIPTQHTFPVFPKESYIGVLADFAELYSRYWESPKEFLYFDAITITGTALSGLVNADFPDLDPYTRLHALKIGPTGTAKKSHSFKLARRFVLEAISPNADELWGKGSVNEGLKILDGAGSGEGVASALQVHRRVLLHFDEFSRFLKKAGAESSILGAIVTELFDSTEYANYLAKNPIEIDGAHLGFASNMPLAQFESSDGISQLEDIGMWNRTMIIVGDRRHRCPIITSPAHKERQVLIEHLADLFSHIGGKPGKPRVLPLTDEAKKWWSTLEDVTGTDEDATRLDTIGMRLLAILAFTSGKNEIDAEIVRAVFAFLRYQKTIRKLFKPSQGETHEAKIEEAILHQLNRRGPMTRRELAQFTHASRYGLKAFRDALAMLGADVLITFDGKKYSLKTENQP